MRTAATVAIAIASIMIGNARAADMSPIPAGAPAVAPPVTYGTYAPNAYGNYNWSGIYLGGNGGYSWNPSGSSFVTSNGLTAGSGNLDGWVFGGQIGYNWQIGAFVVGLEGDLQWSGERANKTAVCSAPCTVTTITATENIDAFATLRARAGIAFDSVLVYGTAGGAWTDATANVNVTGAPAGLNLSSSKVGWTAGGGIEVAVLRNWTAKLEYLYIDTGSISGTAAIPPTLGSGTITESAAIRDSIIRFGFNYRFPIEPWPTAPRY